MSDEYHKALYNRVRTDYPEIPVWEDLTEEQKARMRAANNEYTGFMNDLGDKIRDSSLEAKP